MGLLRTILSLVILLILVHTGLYFVGVSEGANSITQAIYSLGTLVESPATIILDLLGSVRPDFMAPNNFYVISLTAVAAYFILYLLLGIGRN